MKIVIIGAGISGLSTYLFLEKYFNLKSSPSSQHSIKIYEAYDIDSHGHNDVEQRKELILGEKGYAIGITKNGLHVVSRLDHNSGIYNQVVKQGCEVFKWRMSTARGWKIKDISMTSDQAKQVTRDKVWDESLSSINHSVMIHRQAFWHILKEEAIKKQMIVGKKRVKDIDMREGSEANIIEFADGTKEEADLIIGADGLRSTVRKVIFQNSTDGGTSEARSGWLAWIRRVCFGASDPSIRSTDYYTPHYEHLVGVGGAIPSSVLQSINYEPGAMDIIFGPNGFFGHGCTYLDESNSEQSDSISTWWSTFYSADPTPYDSDNSEHLTLTDTFDQKQAVQDLITRHAWWKQPIVQAVLRYVQEHGISQVHPTYTTPELPTWQHAGKAVLVGDAAHALQPSSGQGASQALEDAESLTLLLQHYLDEVDYTSESAILDEQNAVDTALKKFVKMRRPRLHMIYEYSQKMSRRKSNMGFLMEMFMYAILWIMSRVGNDYNEKLLNYSVPDEVDKIIHKK